MKDKVERVMETGKVSLDQVTSDEEREAFKKWTDGFTRKNHPTVIQVFNFNFYIMMERPML